MNIVALLAVGFIGMFALWLMFPDLPDRFDGGYTGLFGFLLSIGVFVWLVFIFPILVLAAVY